MKLKTRLTIAFCAVILIPIVLCGAAILVFSQYQIKSIEKTYDIDFSLGRFSSSIRDYQPVYGEGPGAAAGQSGYRSGQFPEFFFSPGNQQRTE